MRHPVAGYIGSPVEQALNASDVVVGLVRDYTVVSFITTHGFMDFGHFDTGNGKYVLIVLCCSPSKVAHVSTARASALFAVRVRNAPTLTEDTIL